MAFILRPSKTESQVIIIHNFLPARCLQLVVHQVNDTPGRRCMIFTRCPGRSFGLLLFTIRGVLKSGGKVPFVVKLGLCFLFVFLEVIMYEMAEKRCSLQQTVTPSEADSSLTVFVCEFVGYDGEPSVIRPGIGP